MGRVQQAVGPVKNGVADLSGLEAYPITPRQCMYTLDWSKGQCTFQKGVKAFLGYTPEEFTFERIMHSYHPDDEERLYRIISAAVLYCISHDLNDEGFSMLLVYRVRHRNGHYIKVLRHSTIFQLAGDGHMISNLSLLTDISFMDTSDRVYWDVHANSLDKEAFRENVFAAYAGFFTDRETEILRLMKRGLTNGKIAQKLFISKHTVATHRKNIYRKSGCSNVKELLDFAHYCGALR